MLFKTSSRRDSGKRGTNRTNTVFNRVYNNVVNVVRWPDVTIVFDIAGKVVEAAVLAHAKTEARLLSGTLVAVGNRVPEISFSV